MLAAKKSDTEILTDLYVAALSRAPETEEVKAALAHVAKAWNLNLVPMDAGAIGPTDKLLVIGPSAIAASIEAFARGTDLDWREQVTVLATPPAHRHLGAVGAAIVNATQATRLINARASRADVPAGVRLVASADADPVDRGRGDEILRG